MKIILSHDVDHLYGAEHWKDRYWPGVWYRGLNSWLEGSIDLRTYAKRSWPWQRLERIKEVLAIDQSVGAIPTFFYGVSNGLRLSYSLKSVQPHIDYLINQGIHVGLHGMDYDDLDTMRIEFQAFYLLTGTLPTGIRNHYLRRSKNTLNYMSTIGYSFDSTTYELTSPYRVNGMWEIPISLMDVSLGIDTTFTYKKEQTKLIYEKALEKDLPYFVINFHDSYFSIAYPSMKKWYEWFLTIVAQNHTFTNFEAAICELNG